MSKISLQQVSSITANDIDNLDAEIKKQIPASLFDVIISTQEEFEALIASPTWFDAKSVALVGAFTLNTIGNNGVQIPNNVIEVRGFGDASITVTNFKLASTGNSGGIYTATTHIGCKFYDLTLTCTADDESFARGFFGYRNQYFNCSSGAIVNGAVGVNKSVYGFIGNNNVYSNCKASSTITNNAARSGTMNSSGFSGDYNFYLNCNGDAIAMVDSYGKGYGYGFTGSYNLYVTCTSTGECKGKGTSGSDKYSSGFNGSASLYIKCVGKGTGLGSGGYPSVSSGFIGYNNKYDMCVGTGILSGSPNICCGFHGYNNSLIDCSALAYIPTSVTPTEKNCVPIYSDRTNSDLFMFVENCKFPQVALTNYSQGIYWCNLLDNETMVGSIRNNIYHSRFTEPVIAGVNILQENNKAANITVT